MDSSKVWKSNFGTSEASMDLLSTYLRLELHALGVFLCRDKRAVEDHHASS